jgi:hypothetical protein
MLILLNLDSSAWLQEAVATPLTAGYYGMSTLWSCG